jgi:hypothetical protein
MSHKELAESITKETYKDMKVPDESHVIVHAHEMRKHNPGERTGYGCDGHRHFGECISSKYGRSGWIIGWVCK